MPIFGRGPTSARMGSGLKNSSKGWAWRPNHYSKSSFPKKYAGPPPPSFNSLPRRINLHEVFILNYSQVVGFFITKSEHSLGRAIIQEALEIFRHWNPDQNPKYAMTDCDQAEMGALKAVYPGIELFNCDFHVKKAWKDRLKTMFRCYNPDGECFQAMFFKRLS